MDSSRECRHATCPAISPGCERCVTSRNRSPSSPPDPVNSLRPRKRRADPSIAAVHACPNAPTRAVNQPYSLPHRRNTGRAQPTATRNTRIPVLREIDQSTFTTSTAKSNCAKKKWKDREFSLHRVSPLSGKKAAIAKTRRCQEVWRGLIKQLPDKGVFTLANGEKGPRSGVRR